MRFSPQSILPLLALALTITKVTAQTYSPCNPTTQSCSPKPAFGGSQSFSFTGGGSSDFTANRQVTYGSDGAEFTVAQSGDNPQLTSNSYIMFGRVEWVIKAAPGTGIVSSAILQSDCLDEIDWEWLGGDDSQVQSNYFRKGVTGTGSGGFHSASNNHDQFHTYTIDWTADEIAWQVDGVTVRAVTAQQAGSSYPQTPMNVRMGIWAGGDSSNAWGTIQWAGGPTDYSAGPFTMYVKSVKVTDYSTGSQYSYGDMSGTSGSIRSQGGQINGESNGTPVSYGNAPAVTSAVYGTVPLAFDPSGSSSADATRTGWPWVMTDGATATLVTAISSAYTSIAGLPSGWTTPSPSASLPAVSSPASSLSSGLSVRTSWNDQGFPTTITYNPATATLPVSYDSNGFTITPSAPATTPAPKFLSSSVSNESGGPAPPAASALSSGTSTRTAPAATGATSSGTRSGPASEAAPSVSVSAGTSSSAHGTVATSTRQTMVSSTDPSRTTRASIAEATPAAPNANDAARKEVGLSIVAVLAALLLI